jgi:hypothetical protein
VTDPNLRRPTAPPALEPWALDLLEQEGGTDPRTREETARVIALLQQLDVPEPDPARVARLLEALEADRIRPGMVRVAFGAVRRLARPPVALALAAGMAGLVAITVTPESLSLRSDSEPATEPLPVAETIPEAAPIPVRRRSTPVIRPHFVNVSAFSPAPVDRRFDGERDYVLGLDRQLNQLMIDPDAFASRLERVTQRDRVIARLANRAAERGDAPEIALRVRQSRHPLASRIVDRMLNATMVASMSRR